MKAVGYSMSDEMCGVTSECSNESSSRLRDRARDDALEASREALDASLASLDLCLFLDLDLD